MKKKLYLLLILMSILGCNISSKQFKNNNASCLNDFKLSSLNLTEVSNMNFRHISSFLKENHGAKKMRLILKVESNNSFYCEFYDFDRNVQCLIIDINKEVLDRKKIYFDY